MAVFSPRPFQSPNLTTDYRAENQAVQGLADFVSTVVPSIQKAQKEATERAEMQSIGKGISDGTLDYTAAAGRMVSLGRPDVGFGLLKLGETQKQRVLGQDAARELGQALGGTSFLGNPGQVVPQASPSALIQSESGGNWRASNDAVGAGGLTGHFGRAQFGQARLQEAANAGAIPQGTTPQQFMNSPDLQQSAENWHFNDIDRFIASNGFDRAVGQSVNGVPITMEGMRNVAHLGGKNGLQKFIESGGRYNPSDSNGTSLMDYLRLGARSTRVAEADVPASGSMPASLDTGSQGFAIPGEPAMSGRTFDAIEAGGQPLRPVFEAEGVSQPWMGSALQPLAAPAARQAAEVLPPRRPIDLADAPAPGAVPAIGQMPPIDRSGVVDIDPNSSDAGSRTFMAAQARQAPEYPTPMSGGRRVSSPPVNVAANGRSVAQPADVPAPGAAPTQGTMPAPTGSQGLMPVPSSELPRPTTKEEAAEFRYTRQMEEQRGRTAAIAKALANTNLPANARALGEIFLKEALEQSKAPEAIKEFMYAKGMGWTTAKNPAEYAKEKTKVSPAEEAENRKTAAAAAGLKPGDAGYQGYLLTGKLPREDMGPLSATDKKAILEADEGVLAAQTAIRALKDAKGLSPRAHSGIGASARAWAGNSLPDWMIPDRVASPQSSEATSELENVVTSQALAQLKSIFGAAPTEGERKILLEIQGSIGQPDNVRQKIYDRGIAMAEKRLAFNEQRARDLRGGDFYKSQEKRSQGEASQPAQPQQSRQPDMSQARQAPDGKFYVPDPSRPGKYLEVVR